MYGFIVKLGGRRFLLSFWCVNLGAYLNYYGTMSGGEFGLLVGATAAAYIAGGTAQKFTGTKSNEQAE